MTREDTERKPGAAPRTPGDDVEPTGSPTTGRGMERLKAALVWGVTLGLVAYLAASTDLERFWDTLLIASPILVLTITLAEVLASWLYDTFTMSVLFSRFHGRVTLREMLPIRGASYILNVINYNAASVGVSYFLRDKKGVPFFESFGSLMFLNGIDLVSFALMISTGVLLVPDLLAEEVRTPLQIILPLVFAGLLGNILFWKIEHKLPFLHWLTRRALFSAVRRARLSDYGVLLALRLGVIALYAVYQYVLLWMFGVRIPLTAVFVYYPLIVFISILPLSVAGFGTTQLAARYFFPPFVLARAGALFIPAAGLLGAALFLPHTGLIENVHHVHSLVLTEAASTNAIIDAFSTATLTGFLIWRVSLGLICLSRLRKRT